MKSALFIFFSLLLCVTYAQQQQFINVMALNNINPAIQSVQNMNNRNVIQVMASNVQGHKSNMKAQGNKVKQAQVRNANTVRALNRTGSSRTVKQITGNNLSTAGGPNATGNPGNFNVNEDIQANNVSDNNVGNSFDNQAGNLFNPPAQMLENNDTKIQQQIIVISEIKTNSVKENKSINVSLDVSVSRKVLSSSSGSSSSSRSNQRILFKKYAKFKRNFHGKLSSHKKSRHRVDICFNWR